MRIELLGGLRVFREACPLDDEVWQTDKAKALLALLALEPGAFRSTRELTAALWPDAPVERAATNLRGRVRELRLVLEPELSEGRHSRYVRSRNGGYGLADVPELDTDLRTCAAHFDRGERAFDQQDWTAAVEAFEAGFGHCTGDLLPEYDLEEWLQRPLTTWRERLQAARLMLARAYDALGHPRRAASHWAVALEDHPADEEVAGALMRCHLALGRRPQALAVFERCRAALADLALSPGVRLCELRRQTVQEAPALDPAATLSHPPDALLHPPFVGRREERARLLRCADRALGGVGGVAAVLGEAGVGKSRLLGTVLHDLARGEHAPLTLRCQGIQRDDAVSYRSLAELLHPGVEALGREVLDGLPWSCRSQMEALFPGLAPAGQESHPTPPASTRAYLALKRGIHIILDALIERGHRVVLVVEDLQWVDTASLDLLKALTPALAGRPAVLLVSGTWEADADVRALQALDERADGARVELGGWAFEEFEALVDELSRGTAPAELARAVFDRTRGHPLYALTALSALFDDGALTLDGDGRWTVQAGWSKTPPPTAVRATIERQLRTLPPLLREALNAAAVLGPRVPASALHRILARSQHDLPAQLDPLLARRLLVDEGDALRFPYPLMHEVVYDAMSSPQRQKLHRQAARALAAAEVGRTPSLHTTLAHHHELGGEWARAYRHACRALEAALRLYKLEEAKRLLRKAFALLNKRALKVKRRQRERVALHIQEARAHELAGNTGSQERVLQAALRMANALGDPGLQARVHGRFAWLHTLNGDFRAGLQQAYQASMGWDQCRQDGEFAGGLEGLAGLYWHVGHHQTSLTCYAEARRAFEHNGEEGRAAYALDNVGIAARNLDRLGEALDAHERALEAFERRADPLGQGVSCNNLAFWHNLVNQPDEATEWARQAHRLHRALGNPRGLGFAYQNLSCALRLQGRARGARRTWGYAMALYEGIGDRTRQAMLLVNRGLIELDDRAPERALHFFEQGEAEAAALGAMDLVAFAQAGQSRALVALERPDAALARSGQALAWAEQGIRPAPHLLHWHHAQALRATGNSDAADRHAAHAADALARLVRSLPGAQSARALLDHPPHRAIREAAGGRAWCREALA